MSDRLFISFSGGRTSAYMTQRLLAKKPKSTKAVVLFANTGQEHEETLKFVERCDRHFGFNVKWVEAVVSPPSGMRTMHRVVDFASADREGKPYEEVIRKYGLANPDYPHCTRELKLHPMYSYIHDRLGWGKGSYDIAIGIRAGIDHRHVGRHIGGVRARRVCDRAHVGRGLSRGVRRRTPPFGRASDQECDGGER